MAVPEDTGYPLKWFIQQEFVRSMFECAVCLEVVKDPVQVRDCGHQFCRHCLDGVLRSQPHPRCPSCQKDISEEMVFTDNGAKRVIDYQVVNCPNTGCEWNGQLSSLLKEHAERCEFLILSCSNMGCNVQVIRRDLEVHLGECEHRTVHCQYCNDEHVSKDKAEHLESCSYLPVECTNKCSEKDILRNQMEEHLEKVCLKTVVKCKFLEVGCEYECERYNMEEHLNQGMKDHLELSTSKISRLEDKMFSLQDQHQKYIEKVKQEIAAEHQKYIEKVKQEIAAEHQKEIEKVEQEIAAEHQKEIEKVKQEIAAEHQKEIEEVKREIAAEHQKGIEKVKQEIAAEHQKEIEKVKQEIAAVHQKEVEKVKQEIAAVRQKEIEKVKQEIAAVHQKEIEKVKREIAAVRQKDIEKVKQEIAAVHQETQEEIKKVSHITSAVIITDFNRKLSEAKDGNSEGEIYGDPFLTSPLGYKIRMDVNLNETREEYKDHMGVYVCLMKTDHDAMLPWPFKKKYTFTLIDQQDNEQERENIVSTWTPTGEDSFKRPKDEENTGYGSPDFVSHATLKTRKYIKDDTVFITVDIEL